MSPEAFKERLIRLLGDALVWRNPGGAVPILQPILETVPHGLWEPGLCTRDRLELELKPSTTSGYGLDAPQNVTGFRAVRLFRYLIDPPDMSARVIISEAAQSQLDTDCAAAANAHFFAADNVSLAVHGARLLYAVHQQLASGKLPTSYDCEDMNDEECLALVRSMSFENLYDVQACRENGFMTLSCMELSNLKVLLIVRSGGYSRPPTNVKVRKLHPLE